MFEPFFDQYLPSVTFNGGRPIYVPLHPPKDTITHPTSNDWTIDVEELRYINRILYTHVHTSELFTFRHAVTPKTKMIIVNTPHNPVGKVFTKSELESIAAIAEEFNLLIMADEVVRILTKVWQSFVENKAVTVRLFSL